MKTNIVLDDALVAEAARLSGIRTKKALVHEALRVFIAAKKRKSLLDLAGKIELAPGYDYKALRVGATPSVVNEPQPFGGAETAPDPGGPADPNDLENPRDPRRR
jgi:hypothetical protein